MDHMRKLMQIDLLSLGNDKSVLCVSIVTIVKLGVKWESVKKEITQIENREDKFNLATTILKVKKCFWRGEGEQERD